jgi:hypothetical protein
VDESLWYKSDFIIVRRFENVINYIKRLILRKEISKFAFDFEIRQVTIKKDKNNYNNIIRSQIFAAGFYSNPGFTESD